MPTTYTAITINDPAITAMQAGEVITNPGTVSFGTASTTIVVGDLAVCTVLPANHVPVDLVGDIGDADSGTALVFSAGFVGNADGDDDDPDAFGSAYSTGQAGGVFRANAKGFSRIAPVDYDRTVGIEVTTAGVCPATVPEVTVALLCRRAITGVDT